MHTTVSRLLASASFLFAATGVSAQDFNVPGGDLKAALDSYAAQSGVQLMYGDKLVEGARTKGVHGALSPDAALIRILKGTGFEMHRDSSGAIAIVRTEASNLQSNDISLQIAQASPAPRSSVETVTVTSSKLGGADVQSIPIAITALSQEQLQAQKIEGGPDLLKSIPNVTFSKNNFTSYNFSIRGVGTKAISATTDPGVAVSFNDTTLIQNRLFEQEYFDVEQVEVLRGPQGTLYGRNATSGVINVTSAKPQLDKFSGSIKAEVGNYQSRRAVAMLNVPILTDEIGLRLAGSYTKRDGYDFNVRTHNRVNGRDLWSTRATLGFLLFDNKLHGNLIWEHFNENDDRSRTGKQLCHRDDGLATVGNTTVVGSGGSDPNLPYSALLRPALFSQGCKPGSLYDAAAFGTPNGLSLPFVFGMLVLGSDCGPSCAGFYPLGFDKTGQRQTLLQIKDPYGGMMQSADLRVIDSIRDPKYRSKADVYELNMDFELTNSLIFTSQTAYDRDSVYSFQDYNRFNTVPVFTDTSQLYANRSLSMPSYWANLAPGGIFCDPQLGCSNSLAGFDISQGDGKQFSQEFRLQTSFASPWNFSVGVNYTSFKTSIDYYVMYNLITAFAEMKPFNGGVTNVGPDITKCFAGGYNGNIPGPLDINDPQAICPYIDPNPVESINGEGHNYFRSKNPYSLNSKAIFGEVYYQVTDTLKLTAGLRFTDDYKVFIPVPSQVLLAQGIIAGGTVNRGYPELPPIKQHWGKFTGRINAGWTPELDFTDQTMIYASYARGYKGGGANPPTPGFDGVVLHLTGIDYSPTFRPEFVNAYEAGTKNILLGGSLMLNSDVFFYDYKDYQVSQIRDRTAVNENFDARIWGAEAEAMWQPLADLRVNANFGFLHTRIGDGMKSIDIMNRTQGNPDWVLVKPWAQLPSNCIVPVGVAENFLNATPRLSGYWSMCGGVGGILGLLGGTPPIDPATGQPYDSANYPEAHGGAGFDADLSGKELPNSPHFTFNIGAEYTFHFFQGWDTRLRGDFYHQASSWARVYNEDPYDRLHGWNNVNVSLVLERTEDGLAIEFYAKNLLDTTAITDAFLNSDDSALTTNIFTTDPRLLGFSITKKF
jgi:outer membrane receptor protein involved in Fe transport